MSDPECLCCPKQVYKCRFCNREIGFHVDRMECYFCIDCDMIYVYREDTSCAAYGFIIKHRDLEYRMLFRFNENNTKFFRIFVNDANYRQNTRYGKEQKYVLELDFHPTNITPSNAKAKLEKYLAFL